MSATSAASVLATLAAATLILTLTGLWAKARLDRRTEYRRLREKFFSMAGDLIQSDDCPIELAIALRSIGAAMNKLAVLLILVYSAVTRMRVPGLKPAPTAFMTALERSPPAVRASFSEAYLTAAYAVSYRSIIFGAIIRRHLCDRDNDQPRIDPTSICEVVGYGERHEAPEFLESTSGGRLRLKVANG